jgi:ATP synthase protein I
MVAYRLLYIQILLTTISSLIFLSTDIKAAYSAFIGGVICVVPNLVFIIYAYRFGGARAAKKIAGSFYRGEALKVMLTALMFAATFILLPISIGPLMTTYVLCLLVFWVAPILG